MAFRLNVCPGVKKRTGALISAGGAVAISLFLIVLAAALLVLSYRGERDEDRRRALGGLYAVCSVVIACWSILSFVVFIGIRVENKRALLVWLCFNCLLPVLFISCIIYMSSMGHLTSSGTSEIVYLIIMGISILMLVWMSLSILSYYYEILDRDEDPALREPEASLAKPYMYPAAPSGASNAGYGSQYNGSRYGGNSEVRSLRSDYPADKQSYRSDYPPDKQSYRSEKPGYGTGHSDQMDTRSGRSAYKAEQKKGSPKPASRDHSAEREGGGAYYRYQYTGEAYKGRRNSGGSQHSLTRSGAPAKDSVV